MAGKSRTPRQDEDQQIGKLPPQYNFFLNPWSDVRFTSRCPGCDGKIRQRKLPLAIFVEEWGLVVVNKTCRYCPGCELLIAHQDEIEELLAQLFTQMAPEVIGNDYLVVGNLDRASWRRGATEPLTHEQTLDAMHDFKEYRSYEPLPTWVYTGDSDRPSAPR